MVTAFDKLVYDTAQAARVSWFFGQKLLAARLSRPMKLPEALRGRAMPDRRRILADLRKLLEQDWRNISAGLYAPPEEWRGNPLAELARAADFFADLPAVEARRHGESAARLPVPWVTTSRIKRPSVAATSGPITAWGAWVRSLLSSPTQRPCGIWPPLAMVAATRAIWKGDATTCPCP